MVDPRDPRYAAHMRNDPRGKYNRQQDMDSINDPADDIEDDQHDSRADREEEPQDNETYE